MKYFSPSEKGFYDDKIHKTLPKDCIELSQEAFDILFANQAAGIPIIFSGNTVSSKVITLQDQKDDLNAQLNKIKKESVYAIMEAKAMNAVETPEMTTAIQDLRDTINNKKIEINNLTSKNIDKYKVEGTQIVKSLNNVKKFTS